MILLHMLGAYLGQDLNCFAASTCEWQKVILYGRLNAKSDATE